MTVEEHSQKVSLGCGTLILIALIVMIFGSGETDKIEDELRGLRTEITELKTSIGLQTHQLTVLQKKVDQLTTAHGVAENE